MASMRWMGVLLVGLVACHVDPLPTPPPRDLLRACQSDVDCTQPDRSRCDTTTGECGQCRPNNDDDCGDRAFCNLNGFCIGWDCDPFRDCKGWERSPMCCRWECVDGDSDPNHCGACRHLCLAP